jgi:hypothetical protein
VISQSSVPFRKLKMLSSSVNAPTLVKVNEKYGLLNPLESQVWWMDFNFGVMVSQHY